MSGLFRNVRCVRQAHEWNKHFTVVTYWLIWLNHPSTHSSLSWKLIAIPSYLFATRRSPIRVVLDSWVVSQIWLDSDSNESSQSRVGRENEGYESSQSRITLIVIWVRVESTGYCLSQSWVTDFSKRNVKILQLSVTLQIKNQPTATFDRTPPPPPVNNFFPN